MYIKKADTILANAKFDGSKEVRFISLSVFLVWGTFALLNVVVLATDSSIPKEIIMFANAKVCLNWKNKLFYYIYNQDYR